MRTLRQLKTITLALLALSTVEQASAQQVEFPKFSYEGHRGARGLYPENTIQGMIVALQQGVTTLEMDAHITKDNQVVLSHDDYLNSKFVVQQDGSPLTGDQKIIYQMTYDELKKYDTGSKPHAEFPEQVNVKENIPLLASVIEHVEAYVKEHNLPAPFYNIETKINPKFDGVNHPAPAEFVDLLVAVVQEKGISERVVIQSFDPRTIQIVHKKYPNIKTSFLTYKPEQTLEQQLNYLGYTPFIYSPYYEAVTQELVDKAHEAGMKVIPWTVNQAEDIQKLIQLKVDGIISDYPNRFNLK